MRKKAEAKEIGDKRFLLEAHPDKDILREHELVGKKVTVSPLAMESLRKFQGKPAEVTGVVLKHGQLAALEVSLNGQKFLSPKKDFFLYRSYLEDIHLNGYYGQAVKDAMSHWSESRDYYGPSWDGIEAFHWQLAKVAEYATIESAGWYKYPSSARQDMDGKDWRLVLTTFNESVAVNCHSLLHDSVWTLSSTIYTTKDIDREMLEAPIGSSDHWERTLLWTLDLAEKLQTQGYDYTSVINSFKARIKANRRLTLMKEEMIPEIVDEYEAIYGPIGQMLPISVGFSNLRASGPSIGCHDKPSDTQPYSIISIKPKAAKDLNYLRHVLKHELVHYVLHHHNAEGEPPHGKRFQQLAKAVGIPQKYRD